MCEPYTGFKLSKDRPLLLPFFYLYSPSRLLLMINMDGNCLHWPLGAPHNATAPYETIPFHFLTSLDNFPQYFYWTFNSFLH
jgi:hypothetical protein